ncbi:MAG: N-6 DNA methylase [Coleofasciculus chthonoplastes F3-SA18-01]|uniref:HsdM family class I SAM-dependent methyltransferase n=1 Tax=Coleofasciculus chthonoplastes TaxID=64178 RepID=UPI00330007F2
MSQSGLLELAHEKLYWTHPSQIWQPTGAGASVYARLAQEKLGRTIRNLPDGAGVQVGVLAANPHGDDTEAPIAIVCDFPRPISESTLRETYKLAWSFSRSPSLITTEPDRLRVWTCYEEPPTESELLAPVDEISRRELEASLSQQAAETLRLHWAELVSGQFFQDHQKRFQRSKSADQLLLNNLKNVRQQLKKLQLDYNTIHDLLARIIFIQFLFDRKDSQGHPALNPEFLDQLHEIGELSARYRGLPELLGNHRDTYRFFRWLNDRFNGDLFPGKGATEAEREAEWRTEEQKVTQRHLNLLAEFVSGELEMETGQRCLWKQYSFDAIPLDFISSIYEEFIRENTTDKGVHYTPGHIVDFILDGVLPWDSEVWDIKILDPACGSGIFLVKAFQRLIHRWKKAHWGEEITSSILKSLLERNLFGIDINPQAVRVASFSLYLTMCDEIDPRRYWQEVRFPRLRDRQLICADFFREDREGFRTQLDSEQYDLVIGNAPWGKNSMTPLAKSWAGDQWKITYGNIGPLFLPKAVALTKPGGQISMMQPAGVLIFNQISTAKEFRQKLFSELKLEEIVNLSALRFGLFKKAVSPSCIVTMSKSVPNSDPFYYICPKPVRSNEDDYRLFIEPQDINIIYQKEAIIDPLVWTALMWGGRRDLTLVRRLSREQNLERLESEGIVKKRQGVIRGDRKKSQKTIVGKRILKSTKFPDDTLLFLEVKKLDKNYNPTTDSRDSTDFGAFEMPQMILKQGWQTSNKRFQAAIIADNDNQGIICSKSYISVHIDQQYRSILESACLSYNSKLAVYYLFLSSGRFASYRPEPNVEDLLRVPIPEPRTGLLQNVENLEDIDRLVCDAFSFKDSEWVLIEDLFNYTLPDFKGDNYSPGRQTTRRDDNQDSQNKSESVLTEYCEYFLRVLQAGFGQDKNVYATIFQEHNTAHLPIRLVAIHLKGVGGEGVQIEPINSPTLLEQLKRLDKLFLDKANQDDGGIFYQRIARIYDSVQLNGQTIPTIYLIKPDKIRYWTRSMALRDADEVAADIMMWRSELDKKLEVMEESSHG